MVRSYNATHKHKPRPTEPQVTREVVRALWSQMPRCQKCRSQVKASHTTDFGKTWFCAPCLPQPEGTSP